MEDTDKNVRQIMYSYPKEDPSLFLRSVRDDNDKLEWCIALFSPDKKEMRYHRHWEVTDEDLEQADKQYHILKKRLETAIKEGTLDESTGDIVKGTIDQFPDNVHPILSLRQIEVYYEHDIPVHWCVLYKVANVIYDHSHYPTIEEAREFFEKKKIHLNDLLAKVINNK